MSQFNNILVNKPWGHEYLLFENECVAIWHLTIKEGQCTSLHSHPNKKTGLILFSGAATVNFLNCNNFTRLFPGEKIIIRTGVFHRTTANVGDIELLEIETPNNKLDLVRLEDNYGRKGKPYEDNTKYTQIDNKPFKFYEYKKIGNYEINSHSLYKKEELDEYDEKENVFIIIKGNIVSDNFPVVGPGDVLYRNDLKLMLDKFTIPFNSYLEILSI